MRSVFRHIFFIILILLFLFPLKTVFAQNQAKEIHNTSDPATFKKFSAEIEERIKKYMFIVESMGFKLTELIIDSEAKGLATLIFEGKITISDEKFKQLAKKYGEEKKLMTILELIHEREKDSNYSVSPQKVVITTTTPPGIRVHFK